MTYVMLKLNGTHGLVCESVNIEGHDDHIPGVAIAVLYIVCQMGFGNEPETTESRLCASLVRRHVGGELHQAHLLGQIENVAGQYPAQPAASIGWSYVDPQFTHVAGPGCGVAVD